MREKFSYEIVEEREHLGRPRHDGSIKINFKAFGGKMLT
jgi:hypothetical protein